MPASAAESPRRFHFGPYELDVRAGELRKSGRTIKLQKQPLQILKVIEFLNFESGKITPVFSPDKPMNWGIIVSPDSRYLVYVQNDFLQTSLVLVKNFR